MRHFLPLVVAFAVSAETALVFRIVHADRIALCQAVAEETPGPGYQIPLMRVAREQPDMYTLRRVATVIEKIGTVDQRIEVYQQLAAQDALDREHQISFALALVEAGRYTEAEPLFAAALEQAP